MLPSAERELDAIVSYLSSLSPKAASSFLDEYTKQLGFLCEGIVEYPLSRMSELAELGYRTALVNKYLFLYYIDDDMLVVAHVFHQSQNYAALVLY